MFSSIFDLNQSILDKAKSSLAKILSRLVEKEKISQEQVDSIQGRIN